GGENGRNSPRFVYAESQFFRPAMGLVMFNISKIGVRARRNVGPTDHAQRPVLARIDDSRGGTATPRRAFGMVEPDGAFTESSGGYACSARRTLGCTARPVLLNSRSHN